MASIIERLRAAGKAFGDPAKTGLSTGVQGSNQWTPSQVSMGPGEPIQPTSQSEPIRREDYQIGRNYIYAPRAAEHRSVTYDQMRSLADISGVLRTVIEKRKDEVRGLDWKVGVKPEYSQDLFKEEVRLAQKFWERPDRDSYFDQWVGSLMQDLLVIDAPTIFNNRDRKGRLISLEVIDGATINVLSNDKGRVPDPPDMAYQQIIKGTVRTAWTKDDILYKPYNMSSDSLYGFSHVESIIMTVNIALRRDTSFLEWFKSGNIPQGLIQAPLDWTPDQINSFQKMFNTLLAGDLAERSKIHMVPGAGAPTMLNQLQFDAVFDEWLARIICARFGVSPAPYVRMMERATANSVQEAAVEESLVPMMKHLKYVFDTILSQQMNAPYLEFVWVSGGMHYRKDDAQMDDTQLQRGATTINAIRKARGQAPYVGMGDTPMVWTGSGPVPLAQIESGQFAQSMSGGMSANAIQNNPLGEPGGGGFELPRLSLGDTTHPVPGQGRDLAKAEGPPTAKSELEAWERFTLARLGKRPGRAFEATMIPAEVAEQINTGLLEAKTPGAVKAVFDLSRTNLLRKRTPVVRESLDELIEAYRVELMASLSGSGDAAVKAPPEGHAPYNTGHDEQGRFASGGGYAIPEEMKGYQTFRATLIRKDLKEGDVIPYGGVREVVLKGVRDLESAKKILKDAHAKEWNVSGVKPSHGPLDPDAARLGAKDFDPEQHPKAPAGSDNGGQFVSAGGGGGGSSDLKPAQSHTDLPAHIQALKPPPAWTNLRYSDNPDAKLLLIGTDSKGRDQYVYSQSHHAEAALAKFSRIAALDGKMDEITSQLAVDIKAGSENAACLELIRQTGIRPGSDDDTKATVKAFGATTLLGQHVQLIDNELRLVFVGKKGVKIEIPVYDEDLIDSLLKRKAAAGDNGRLFNTNDGALRDYAATLDGGGFHPKDLRTHLATSTAEQLVKEMTAPKDEKEYKRAVIAVAKVVSMKLGNTPVVALQNYIAPSVFAEWRLKAHV